MNWQAAYDALVTDCGAVTLADWTEIQLTGSDRVKFMQNICTNDLRTLPAGESREVFCTDVKGKILAHVVVIAETQRLFLLTVPGHAERLIAHLDRYIIREDVQLADGTDEAIWSYVVGPRAGEFLASLPGESVSCDLLWPAGALVRVNKKETQISTIPIVDTTSPAWQALRMESCWPLFGTDFSDTNLPQEINRDRQAISFTKGCYLGQETVARIDALGHVNKKLVLVKFTSTEVPVVGTALINAEQAVGTVTSSAWSPALSAPLAIAAVRRGSNDVGTKFVTPYGAAEVIEPLSATA